MTAALRIGTRGSRLAMAQTTEVADRLTAELGREVELIEVRTEGDATDRPLTEFGGQGVFVSALREALIRGDVDVAVHSLKDLPTATDAAVALAAVPTRQDPRDVLVARDRLTLGELPAGARVGTGSPRRAAQLRALGLGLDVVPIRGNVDTRIDKALLKGEVDGVVLARAGLARLGRLDDVTEVLDPLQMLPSPGQGALAVECRADDHDLVAQVRSAADDAATRAAVAAERSLLATLEAGCAAPVGALAEIVDGGDGDELWLRAVVLDLEGRSPMRTSTVGAPDDAIGVGRRLAEQLLTDGAADLYKERVT
ncbi:MAG TPA: hydroxymethylbilane synthase [Nocardioidaceae bacterium]|nr:hydroxymethylbilane synthase [Nocardioidaceae bacterium]